MKKSTGILLTLGLILLIGGYYFYNIKDDVKTAIQGEEQPEMIIRKAPPNEIKIPQTPKGRLKEQLGLDVEQEKKFDASNASFKEEAEKLRADNPGNKQAIGQGMKALQKKQMEEMKEILTPAQYEKMLQLLRGRGQRQKEMKQKIIQSIKGENANIGQPLQPKSN